MKFKKRVLCLALTVALLMGLSTTAFAGTGNINYGGATVSWEATPYKTFVNFSHNYTASLKTSGTLYVQSGTTPVARTFQSSTFTSNRFNVTFYPPNGYVFVNNAKTTMTIYINGSAFVTYKPVP